MLQGDTASKILARFQEAKTAQTSWAGIWRDLADYVKPDRDVVGAHNHAFGVTPNTARFDLFDGTAMQGNLIYAAGCMSYLTPADQPWFKFEPPQWLNDDDAAKSWLAEVTEITQALLATSNFYGQIHQCWLEDGAFGTPSIFVEPGRRHVLRFQAREIGDFAILENDEGYIDTWFHEFTLTARQAAQKFGDARDSLPDAIKAEIAEGGAKAENRHQFLHAIYPREDAERDRLKIDGENMPFASVYLHLPSKGIVRVSGFWEAPEATGRHIKWGKSPFGIPPFLYALADQRQLNDLQMNMDVLAEVAAFPRILAHANLEGEIDLRRSGVTYYGKGDEKAEEWLTGGRYDVGLDRVRERQEAVKRAFHVELFQMFSSLPAGKEMTATETMERMREKLTLFSPTFASKTSEMLDPMLYRVYGLLLRGGHYPQPPDAMISDLGGAVEVANPRIVYTSRIAMALKAIQGSGFARAMEAFSPFLEIRPDILDNVDLDRAFRDTLRNNGAPEDWIPDEGTIAQLRDARAKAQAAEQQKMEAMAAADQAANLAKSGLIDTAA